MKIVTVLGARPQFIKAAPVCRALCRVGVEELLVDTGQHYDDAMAGAFFRELNLPKPAYSLGVGSGSHGRMTGKMLERIEAALEQEQPAAVLVYGDTNSTLAGALAAAKMSIPVVHVEAGLRSYRPAMAEEINRRLTDHVSRILFCPTETAVENLRAEGISGPRADAHLVPLSDCREMANHVGPIVLNVGDVMVDALLNVRDSNVSAPDVDALAPRSYALVTLHRAESTDDPGILAALVEEIASLSDELAVLFPVHPRTRARILGTGLEQILRSKPKMRLVEPMSYANFVRAQAQARVIVTDSGGVQKEAYILRVPCLTLREETEWPETVESGWNRILGCRPSNLAEAALAAQAPTGATAAWFGDGHAADRIAEVIASVVSR